MIWTCVYHSSAQTPAIPDPYVTSSSQRIQADGTWRVLLRCTSTACGAPLIATKRGVSPRAGRYLIIPPSEPTA